MIHEIQCQFTPKDGKVNKIQLNNKQRKDQVYTVVQIVSMSYDTLPDHQCTLPPSLILSELSAKQLHGDTA